MKICKGGLNIEVSNCGKALCRHVTGYLEGGGYLVSWCVGQLLELAQPEAYGEQYARWHYGDLPILPEEWKYEVPKDKKKQLDLLCRLMKDKRVDSVVCATDAGREGELIFRLVYEHPG